MEWCLVQHRDNFTFSFTLPIHLWNFRGVLNCVTRGHPRINVKH